MAKNESDDHPREPLITWESGAPLDPVEFAEEAWARTLEGRQLAALESRLADVREALETSEFPDGERMDASTRERLESYCESAQREIDELQREKQQFIEGESLYDRLAIPEPWKSALRDPYPPDDLFLNPPRFRREGTRFIASSAADAEGLRPQARVVVPGFLPQQQYEPGPFLGIWSGQIRGLFAGGYTSWPIDYEREPLLKQALEIWLDRGRPGPLHPLTVAGLLLSPDPRCWRSFSVNVVENTSRQFKDLREMVKQEGQVLRETAGRPSRLDVGRRVLVYIWRRVFGLGWEAVGQEMPTHVSPQTLIGDNRRLLKNLSRALPRVCDEYLRATARSDRQFEAIAFSASDLVSAWYAGPGRCLDPSVRIRGKS